MNYEGMADIEINEAVKSVLIYKHEKESDFDKFFLELLKGSNPDYCNDPSEAWPIMLRSKIGVTPLAGGDFTLWYAHDEFTFDINSMESVYNENPLRAAMIVYLMMNDKQEEK